MRRRCPLLWRFGPVLADAAMAAQHRSVRTYCLPSAKGKAGRRSAQLPFPAKYADEDTSKSTAMVKPYDSNHFVSSWLGPSGKSQPIVSILERAPHGVSFVV
jgi:hypothetical protein